MKSRQLLLIAIVASFLFLRCTEQKEQVRYEELNLAELFNYFMNTSDSIEEQKLISFLNDSIVKYPYGMFYPIEFIDTTSNQVKFEFGFYSNLYGDEECFKIKHRNIFYVNIDSSNHMSSRLIDTLSLSSLKQLYKEFILNKNNSYELPEKRIKFIPLLDTIQVSKGALFIRTQLISDSTKKSIDWFLIKNVIKIAKLSTVEMRNENAQLYFNKSYQEASLKEKWALSQYHPIQIWFYPNSYQPKPPPPPLPILSPKVLELLEETEDDEELELVYEIFEEEEEFEEESISKVD